jgi:hypothetical protein
MPIFLWLRTSTPREAAKLEHLSNSARNDEYDSAFPVLFLLELKISEPVCRICKSTNLHWDRPILKGGRNWKLRVHRYFDWAGGLDAGLDLRDPILCAARLSSIRVQWTEFSTRVEWRRGHGGWSA